MEGKDIVLNNGVTMPPIGYGVFRMTNPEEWEELYEDGKVKSIGVDNFTQDRMADFLFFKQDKTSCKHD